MLEKVKDEYIELVVPSLYNWLSVPAHGFQYFRKGSGERYPEQSMFWHVVNSVMIGCNLLEYFEKEGYNDVFPRELFTYATLHDIDKVLGLGSEKKVTLAHVEHAYSQYGLSSFCPSTDLEMIQKLIECSHAAKHTQNFGKYLGNPKFNNLLRFHFLMDGLATIQSPRESYKVKGKQDRTCYEWLLEITGGKYELLYHEINIVIGFLTNTLNSSIAEIFKERIEKCQPILYFPNGTVYIAPTGAFDKYITNRNLEEIKTEILEDITNKFYTKFLKVIESTEQIIGVTPQNQLIPTGYSFLFNAKTLIKAAKSWVKRRLQNIRSIEGQIDTLAANSERSKKEEIRLKNLSQRRDGIIKTFKENQLPKIKEIEEKQPSERKRILGFVIDNLGKTEKVELAELKVLSDLVAYFVRLGEKLGIDSQMYKRISEFAEIEQNYLEKFKVKTSGGVNFKPIVAVLYWYQNKKTKSTNEGQITELSVVKQAKLKNVEYLKVTAEGFIDSFINEMEDIFVNINKLEYERSRRKALLEEEILADDSILEEDSLKEPVEKPLLEDLAKVISENLEFKPTKVENMAISRFGINDQKGNSFCNFCGRPCAGIKVTAKMTIVDAPTNYSNYNWLESVEQKKRRKVCAVCFFENILRFVLYPKNRNQNKSLSVFIFPEYTFTPRGAEVFKKQVKDCFPKAIDDESNLENKPPSGYFLKAIQHVLGNAPKDITEDELVLSVLFPLLVVPLNSDNNLKNWITKTKDLLSLWSGLGLKYILTSNFYPEIESVSDVKGAVELKGVHHTFQTRLKRWIMSLRKESLIDIPETVFSIKEAKDIYKLMQEVQEISKGLKEGERRFYTDHLSFSATNILAKAKKGKNKEV